MITSLEQLEALYAKPSANATAKVSDAITPHYAELIAASPFMIFATHGKNGLDASPRGDERGFVRVIDRKTIRFADRLGNNRVDSFRNIMHDPHVAFVFLIPGSGTTLRISGRAVLLDEPDVRAAFAVEGRLPRLVVQVAVDTVFFHCSRAIMRSHVWDPATFVAPGTLPTAGDILAGLSGGSVGGPAYDEACPNAPKPRPGNAAASKRQVRIRGQGQRIAASDVAAPGRRGRDHRGIVGAEAAFRHQCRDPVLLAGVPERACERRVRGDAAAQHDRAIRPQRQRPFDAVDEHVDDRGLKRRRNVGA
jgi:hypothetical protein